MNAKAFPSLDEVTTRSLDGTPKGTLNTRLVVRQGLDSEEIEALCVSHTLREVVFELATRAKDQKVPNSKTLKMLAQVYEALQFEQQKLWRFEPTADHHRFFDLPGCACPKLDNEDRLGTPYKIYSEACPIHKDRVA
jgi:hypothetical protein